MCRIFYTWLSSDVIEIIVPASSFKFSNVFFTSIFICFFPPFFLMKVVLAVGKCELGFPSSFFYPVVRETCNKTCSAY